MATPLDDFGKLAKKKYVDNVTLYNEQVTAAKSVSSKEEFEKTWLDTDPSFAEENDKIGRLKAALEDVLQDREEKAANLLDAAYDKAVADSGVDLVALDEQLKGIRATSKYLTIMYGEEVLEGTPDVEKRARSGGSGAAGSGGRRIRGFDVYIDGVLAAAKNAKGEVKSTFSVAAKELKVETIALQRAFFDAAGTEDISDDSFPSVVEFQFNDSKVRAVKVGDSEEE